MGWKSGALCSVGEIRSDGNGLYLTVTATGAKSWVFLFGPQVDAARRGGGLAAEGFAETLRFRFILGAEPTVRRFRTTITAATFQVINPTVACDVRTHGKFRFYRTAERHCRVARK